MMKYKSEDRVKILEYKFIFEEDIQVKKEYEEGSADLNYRLSFFRNKLDNKKGEKNQQHVYDTMFMPSALTKTPTDNKSADNEKTKSANKPNSAEPWAKKMYRKIVVITHPDKTMHIQSDHLKNKLVNQYRIAQKAYSQKIYSDLIMVAFDLDIDIPEKVIKEEISPALIAMKKTISKTRETIGWQWYYVPEKQRDAELKKILAYYGFKFTDEKVNEVIRRKRSTRKVGTRPENLNAKRRILRK